MGPVSLGFVDCPGASQASTSQSGVLVLALKDALPVMIPFI